MKILVNVLYPDLEKSAVNKAWVRQLEKTANTTVRKICQRYPDGKIGVPTEQETLPAHDRLVFQHPSYWYSVPPLMRQWIDEMLTYGWVYDGGNALAGKEWVCAISIGGPMDSYQAGSYNGHSMSEFLKPLQQTANLVQTKFLPPFVFHGAIHAAEAEIEQSACEPATHIIDPPLDPQRKLAALVQAMNDEGVSLQPAYLIFIESRRSRVGGNGSSR